MVSIKPKDVVTDVKVKYLRRTGFLSINDHAFIKDKDLRMCNRALRVETELGRYWVHHTHTSNETSVYERLNGQFVESNAIGYDLVLKHAIIRALFNVGILGRTTT